MVLRERMGIEASWGAGSGASACAMVLFALVLPLVSACTTTGENTGENMEAGLQWFATKPVDQLVQVIGHPTWTLPADQTRINHALRDGNNLFYVWEYRDTRPSSDSAYVMRSTTDGRYTYGPPAPKACWILVEVANGVVVGWHWNETGNSSYLGGCARYARRFQRHLEATP